jgi:hypothetical protein
MSGAKMEAGRKLDEWVALQVLGWEREGAGWRDPESGEPVALRRFSHEIAAAWEVVDRICDRGFRMQLSGSRIWQARFYKSAAHTLETHAVAVTGASPAEAICLAAVELLGSGEPG